MQLGPFTALSPQQAIILYAVLATSLQLRQGYLVMHESQSSQNRHQHFTCNLILPQVAPWLGQLSIQVTPQGILLHHIDALAVFKGCVDLDYAVML